ncbi:hypothetical protein OOK31_16070 [Streptomyces sp. NBC_00249]|uniref:hypothetical protein n=1 Tax=Streptomyces sp. NBC_00249 TaxID=2975690 RepID=UPI002250FCCF|nr:hypothetical protein [Streptomyces sp. NBC_00249]MCX5195400.1 hypothetical protein [Streptomyces sp. NBC_00249]
MRTSTRFAGVLTALTLVLGGAGLAASGARADIPACTAMVEQAGVSVTDAVSAACYRGVVGDLGGCVTALTEAGVPGGSAGAACRAAPGEPR